MPALEPGDVAVSLYLIGDAGKPDTVDEPVLAALHRDAGSRAGERVILFLGDNAYPRGLPVPGQPGRRAAERSLAAQVEAITATGSRGYFVPGNHDYRAHDIKDEPYLYLKTFGPQRYIDEQSTWAPEKRTYGGASPATPTFAWAGMNTYHRFNAGGYKFLNIALQYDPDDNDLKWAQQIINENPGLPTIVTSQLMPELLRNPTGATPPPNRELHNCKPKTVDTDGH